MPHGALENVKLAGERDIDPRVAETDDIRQAVPVHVAQLARKLIVADPAAIVGRECTGCVLDWGEVAAAGGERDIDPRLAEADNVGHAVAVYVGEFARILVIADPAPDIASGPECVDLELHGAEISAAGGECHIGSAHAETDDVRHAVAVDVAKLARILVVAAPAADSASGPECLQLELHGGEIAATSGERDIDSADAEAAKVGHAVAVHVAELARILVVAAPAADG